MTSAICQRFRKFRSKFKWKDSFRFLLTGIFWRWSTYFGRNIPTEIRPFIFDKPLLGNSVTKFKITTAISIGSPDLIGKCRSIMLRYSRWSLTGQFGIMESTQPVWRLDNYGGGFGTKFWNGLSLRGNRSYLWVSRSYLQGNESYFKGKWIVLIGNGSYLDHGNGSHIKRNGSYIVLRQGVWTRMLELNL